MMDCERFDHVVIDALYGELDELTLAATRRHAEGCTRCQTAWAGLRATRKIGVLPLAPVPLALSERAVAYARDAQRNVSVAARFGRVMSRAAAYAMRPQTAMAAIFMLAMGGAVLFLRPRPERSAAQSHVSVTERGVPEVTGDHGRHLPSPTMGAPTAPIARRDETSAVPAAPPVAFAETASVEGRTASGAKAEDSADWPSPRARAAAPRAAMAERRLNANGTQEVESAPGAAAKRGDVQPPAEAVREGHAGGQATSADYARAKELYQAQRYADAERAYLAVAGQGGKEAPWAEFYAAKSAESANGCYDAAAKYEAVETRHPNTGAGAEGLFSAANCHKTLGNTLRARQLYTVLRALPAHRDRADAELASLPTPGVQAQAARALPRAVAPAAGAASAGRPSATGATEAKP